MIRTFIFSLFTLTYSTLLSSLLLLAGPLVAHEVSPTIGDLYGAGGKFRMELRMSAEGFLAGIDLDSVADTGDAPQAQDYESLRALDPKALTGEIESQLPEIASKILVKAGETIIPLTGRVIEVAAIGDVELPRHSQIAFEGALPSGTQTVQINWPTGYGTLILRQMDMMVPNSEGYAGYLEGGQSTPEIVLAGGPAASGWSVFASYIPVGFDHILPKGLDHILFVLGLFFFSTALRPLLLQVTAFTLAHTVTLAMGALGVVSIPGSIVEPLIAASIVYVAIENTVATGLNRFRPLVIFGFGLLHGLGFASVLGEFGLPEGQFIPALIGFNVGVEFGQLTVIAAAFLAVGFWFGNKPWYRSRIAIPASLMIAAVGAYWFVERVFF